MFNFFILVLQINDWFKTELAQRNSAISIAAMVLKLAGNSEIGMHV